MTTWLVASFGLALIAGAATTTQRWTLGTMVSRSPVEPQSTRCTRPISRSVAAPSRPPTTPTAAISRKKRRSSRLARPKRRASVKSSDRSHVPSCPNRSSCRGRRRRRGRSAGGVSMGTDCIKGGSTFCPSSSVRGLRPQPLSPSPKRRRGTSAVRPQLGPPYPSGEGSRVRSQAANAAIDRRLQITTIFSSINMLIDVCFSSEAAPPGATRTFRGSADERPPPVFGIPRRKFSPRGANLPPAALPYRRRAPRPRGPEFPVPFAFSGRPFATVPHLLPSSRRFHGFE